MPTTTSPKETGSSSKIEAHTGEIIEDDAVFTLYQWNQARGLYEVSKDYAFVRDAEGLYTITSLHDDWTNYVEGNLYYEDTLCDVREDTVNSDGTISEHPIYYTDHEPVNFPIEDRAVTNDMGNLFVIESRKPVWVLRRLDRFPRNTQL